MTFSFSAILTTQFRGLFRKGISFQALSLGNAILAQGNLIIVQVVLGPAAVVLFATARTLVGSVTQALVMMNQITWSEFSFLLGKGDLVGAARLHHIGSLINYIIALCGTVILATVGQSLYSLWTGGAIEMPQHLILLFLLPILFSALYSCSGIVHAACNQLEGLATRYLLGTVFSLFACLILSFSFGIEGAVLSIVVVNLVSMHYVFVRALQLTGDTWFGFVRGVAHEAVSVLRHVKIL
jgi:O-antigen/teichoic acid export membrane protein